MYNIIVCTKSKCVHTNTKRINVYLMDEINGTFNCFLASMHTNNSGFIFVLEQNNSTDRVNKDINFTRNSCFYLL